MQQQAKSTERRVAPEADVLDQVFAYARHCEQQGRYAYEGQWLIISEIEERIRGDRRRGRLQSLELLCLFIAVYGLSALSLSLIWLLAY